VILYDTTLVKNICIGCKPSKAPGVLDRVHHF
jgi:hypothetical protein